MGDKNPTDTELRENAPTDPTTNTDVAITIVNKDENATEKKKITVADLSGFIAEVGKDFTDGDVSFKDVLRVVPRLVSELQKFDISGADKGALALEAFHLIVDTYVPAENRATAKSLVNTIVPPSIDNVLDIAKGRVSFANGVQAAVTQMVPQEQAQTVEQAVNAAEGCFAFLSKCIKK